jgi:hypothetical protein
MTMFNPEDEDNQRPTGDQIVYTVVQPSGGVDGMDPKTYPKQILFATLDKQVAQNNHHGRYEVEKQIVDFDEALKAALSKLNPIDLLVLGIEQKSPSVPATPASKRKGSR